MSLRIAIAGAAGRMGTRIAALAAQDSAMKVVYGLEAPGKSAPAAFPIGSDFDALSQADVVIDFTVAAVSMRLLPEVRKHGKAYVIGTTGFSATEEAAIAEAARVIPIVKSSNMSSSVNVFFKVAEQIAKALPYYTVHIQETHHVHKKDAPSGTALQAGRLIESVSHQKPTYESMREGEVIGDHRVIFKGPADRLELFHHAESRDIFAAGALQAARWVAGRAPKLYSMTDVLGFEA
jgi:4-hydroxy-tetrahydrodipicolinate reductase